MGLKQLYGQRHLDQGRQIVDNTLFIWDSTYSATHFCVDRIQLMPGFRVVLDVIIPDNVKQRIREVIATGSEE